MASVSSSVSCVPGLARWQPERSTSVSQRGALSPVARARGPWIFECGASVISCDPIYQFDVNDIRDQIAVTYERILDELRRNVDDFVWDSIASVDELGRIRMAAMQEFLEDYAPGRAQRRYIQGELPTLMFADSSFDLALCSHLLFLYSDQLGEAFHRSAIQEMCRVAAEVRIFPLLALGGHRSPYVDRIVDDLRDSAAEVSIENVPYEFQRGGNQMLRIWRTTDSD